MYLGIDFGMRKIGLAVVDTQEKALVLPLGVFKFSDVKKFLRNELKEIVAEYSIDTFVVGVLPSGIAGDSDKREAQHSFEKLLMQLFPTVAIEYIDEQRSTKEAKRIKKDNPDLKNKNDDALAASIILETYLSQNMNHGKLD